jgi:hypothetical protein
MPDVGLANVRFHPGPHRSLEVEQAGGRTDKNGQFVLAIGKSQYAPSELFEQALLAEVNGDIAGAERLYRILMEKRLKRHICAVQPWKFASCRLPQC